MEKKKRGGSWTTENAPKSPGRPTMTEEEKKLRKLTKTEFRNSIQKYLHMSVEELTDVRENSGTSAVDMMVISIVLMAIRNGDERRLNYFIEQLFGKMKEVYEVEQTNINKDDFDYSKLTDEEALALKKLKEKIGA